jgi:hypothetical protein
MSRRPARNQKLPQTETLFLNSLDYDHKVLRVQQLFRGGWTLSAIGSALYPPKGRSSVKAWVDRPSPNVTVDVPIPDPTLKTSANGYQRKTPKSPGVPPITAEELRRLAPLARRFRSGMASSSPESVANSLFTQMAKDLRANNVSIADIARAAGVTHRAISRRLGS